MRWKSLGQILIVVVVVTLFIISLSVLLRNKTNIDEQVVTNIVLSVINALAVTALAYFTYYYAKANIQMASEMKKTNDMQFDLNHRPKVTMRFDKNGEGLICIVIENVGNGAAKNIKFTITPELESATMGKLSDRAPALKNGVNYLPPKMSLIFPFGAGPTEFNKDNKLPKEFKVNIQYDYAVQGKETIKEECLLELTLYKGTLRGGIKDLSTLVGEVKKIGDLLGNISRIAADTTSLKDIDTLVQEVGKIGNSLEHPPCTGGNFGSLENLDILAKEVAKIRNLLEPQKTQGDISQDS
jgi:hypothetical protein